MKEISSFEKSSGYINFSGKKLKIPNNRFNLFGNLLKNISNCKSLDILSSFILSISFSSTKQILCLIVEFNKKIFCWNYSLHLIMVTSIKLSSCFFYLW